MSGTNAGSGFARQLLARASRARSLAREVDPHRFRALERVCPPAADAILDRGRVADLAVEIFSRKFQGLDPDYGALAGLRNLDGAFIAFFDVLTVVIVAACAASARDPLVVGGSLEHLRPLGLGHLGGGSLERLRPLGRGLNPSSHGRRAVRLGLDALQTWISGCLA